MKLTPSEARYLRSPRHVGDNLASFPPSSSTRTFEAAGYGTFETSTALAVVRDFDLLGTRIRADEADAIRITAANAMLALAIAAKRFHLLA